eukprot:gnl/MRDRNA2_/MRDRNA2_17417_c0_seq1.p1 gnl/MRDRNA2_/MRDRNA2_17417_c0~~gnl/MRDRNA2_/MRDRNA2_17417_c0_seq1.p1  ORF type:complete len:235 (+),score=65.99 gnl/MRDRNA2_/MRDRNA2_17417_c0_seq1:21-725(+)
MQQAMCCLTLMIAVAFNLRVHTHELRFADDLADNMADKLVNRVQQMSPLHLAYPDDTTLMKPGRLQVHPSPLLQKAHYLIGMRGTLLRSWGMSSPPMLRQTIRKAKGESPDLPEPPPDVEIVYRPPPDAPKSKARIKYEEDIESGNYDKVKGEFEGQEEWEDDDEDFEEFEDDDAYIAQGALEDDYAGEDWEDFEVWDEDSEEEEEGEEEEDAVDSIIQKSQASRNFPSTESKG